ncbi:MAG: ABC transporter ATP-binding protein [Conexivisphaerales archaeon]
MPDLRMEGISKTYPNGVRALIDVNFEARDGEIHGLLGENGAGKTTLMNILYGAITKDAGNIYLNGDKVEIHSPSDALKLGIGMVHQHFMLIPAFTVAENVALMESSAKDITKKLDLERVKERIRVISRTSGLEVDPDALVENLAVGQQQRVDILKLLYRGANLLLLDEPTSVLNPLEIRQFFEVLRRFKQERKTIIFITHKLEEILEVCDRVTVLRRGRVVGTADTKGVSTKDLAVMMIGAGSESLLMYTAPSKPPDENSVVLKVENLVVTDSRGVKKVDGVSFEIHAGEIFGIAGVEGNGQAELVRAIAGIDIVSEGKIYLDGKELKNIRKTVIESGVGYIPDDRLKWGLCGNFSLAENIILGVDVESKYNTRFYLNYKPIKQMARELIRRFRIVAPNENVPVKSLSGGNQQKVITAREISKEPRIIIAHEPTHGLDISATRYIHDLLLELRNQGRAVLLVSSDIDEILKLSDRVAVMSRGKIVGISNRIELNLESLGLMMGGVRATAK